MSSVLLVNFHQDLENVNFVLQEVFRLPKEQLNANFTSVCVELNQILEILGVIFVMLVNFHQMKDIANHVHQEQCHLMMDNVNVMTVVLVLKQHQLDKHVNFVTPENFRQDLENVNFVLKGPFQHP